MLIMTAVRLDKTLSTRQNTDIFGITMCALVFLYQYHLPAKCMSTVFVNVVALLLDKYPFSKCFGNCLI